MKILITGSEGFLGTKLYNILSKEYETIGIDTKKDISQDITYKECIDFISNKIRPDIVIHAAAYTDVDGCEKNKELAYKINSDGTKNIVDACKKLNSKLIYISTDFVFNGDKGNYEEKDITFPINKYGFTKLFGELHVDKLKDSLIIRSSMLYGHNGNETERSFMHWAYKNLKNNKQINVVTDQKGTPTLTDDIAYALIDLIEKNATGIYHVAGSERASKYESALKLAEIFNFNKDLINPVDSEYLKQVAKRPKDSSLNTDKLKSLGIEMSDLEKGLSIMKEQIGD